MKKIMLLVFLLAGTVLQSQAQQRKFIYYPAANLYFDPAEKTYIYAPDGNWIRVKKLPPGHLPANSPAYTVYSTSPEVWKMNGSHKLKYKHTPNGKATGYQGSNPNKAKGKGKKG